MGYTPTVQHTRAMRSNHGEGRAPGAIHPEIQTSADDPEGNLPGHVTLTFTRARALPFTQYPDPVTKETAYVASSYVPKPT